MVKKNSDALAAGYELNASQYEIKYLLGSGGFGLTYLAYDCEFERSVAIKEFFPRAYAQRTDGDIVLKEEYHQQFNASLQAFEKEGKALAKCDHSGVVEVFDRFEEHGTAYLVMKLIQGSTLDVWMKHHSGDFISQILQTLLDALEHIHHKKLVHRDLKPANIMIREDNVQPVLIDFGATRIDFDRDAKNSTISTTKAYAAPELFAGNDLGHATPASDLYALGAMLYEFVTGKLPTSALARATNNDELGSVTEAVLPEYAHHRGLLKAIDAALVMNPKQRLQDVPAFRTLLKKDRAQDTPSSFNPILNEESPVHHPNDTHGEPVVLETMSMDDTNGDQSDPANEKHTTSKNTTQSDVTNGSKPKVDKSGIASAMLLSVKRHSWLALFCIVGSFVLSFYAIAHIIVLFGNSLLLVAGIATASAALVYGLAIVYENFWKKKDNIKDDIALFIGMGLILCLTAGLPYLSSKDYEQELCRDFYSRSFLNPFGLHIVSASCQVTPKELYQLFKNVTPIPPLDLQTESGASTFHPGDKIALNMRGFGEKKSEKISVLVDSLFYEGKVLMVKHYKGLSKNKLYRQPDGVFNYWYGSDSRNKVDDKSCKINHTFCLTAKEPYGIWTFVVAVTNEKWPDSMFLTEDGANQEPLSRYYSRLLQMKYSGVLPPSSMDDIKITVAPKH